MQHLHQTLEDRLHSLQRALVDSVAVCGLHHLQQPATELVPEQTVSNQQCVRDAVCREVLLDLHLCCCQALLEPFDREAVALALLTCCVNRPAANQLICVPNLVTEVTALLAQRVVEHQVVTCRRAQHHSHTHTVSTILSDQIQRIGRIAQLLRHLATDLIAHDTREVNIAEGHLAAILITRHNHTSYPEEDDIGTRNQVVGRIVILDLLVLGIADTVKYRDRPQPRREPGVEYILVLTQVAHLQRVVASLSASQFQCLLSGLGNYITTLGQIVSRNALTPPQLTRDTPVLDVLHPVAVYILIFLGNKLDLVLHHRAGCGLSQFLHRQEPLHRQLRLDGHTRTLRETYVVGVSLGLLQQVSRSQILLDLLTNHKAVHTYVHTHLVVQRTVVVEDVDGLQTILLAEHIVVHVVCGSNLQCTRTELDIDIRIADNGNRATNQRHNHTCIGGQPRVTLVIGINTQSSITQNGLGAGCSHDDRAISTLNLITQVVELTVRLLVDHLLVRESCLCRGVPVDHTNTAIDLTLVVEINEDLDHTLGARIVHREAGTIPVARCTQLTQLLEDDAAVLLLPLPSVTQELLAGQVSLVDTLSLELSNHLSLGSNRRVVGTRHPAGILALHTCATHQHVLQRVVQHMAHMQHTSYVGGRNYDGVSLALIGRRVEEFMINPIVVPFALDLLGRVLVCNVHSFYFFIFNRLFGLYAPAREEPPATLTQNISQK